MFLTMNILYIDISYEKIGLSLFKIFCSLFIRAIIYDLSSVIFCINLFNIHNISKLYRFP